MSTSVYRPHNSAFWYARATRPRALDHLPGPKEFRRSTGERDKRRAKTVAAKLISAQCTAWFELMADPLDVEALPTVLNAGLVRQLCAVRLYCWMDSDEDQRRGGLRLEEVEAVADTCVAAERMLRSALSQGPESQYWSHVASEALGWAASQGHELLRSDPLLADYVRAFARAELDANAAISRRNQGDDVATPERPAGDIWRMSAIVPHFLEHKGPTRDTKHVQTIVNAWRLLTDYCGDIALEEVTSEHIYGFLLERMKTSQKPWSYERARGFGQRALRDVFGFARTKGLMKGANPLPPDGLEAFPVVEQGDRHEQPRFPFTTSQLNALFASDWYDPASDVFRGKMRQDLGARYWVPLLSTHHGNRVREGVQLVASDFVWEDRVLVLRYREAVDGEVDSAAQQLRSLKCSSSQRPVPVHPKLIELGIANFVDARRQQDGPNAWLFPSCEPKEGGKDPQLGRAYEQSFLRHVRDRLEFGNGFGNHSFRHQLEDRMREAQARNGAWPPGLSQQYTGRVTVRPQDKTIVAQEGSERLYGNGYTPAAMLGYVRQLDFTGVNYPQPYEKWLRSTETNGV